MAVASLSRTACTRPQSTVEAVEAMTHTISIVTAVHEPSAHLLSEAYASLAAQQMPDGWAWEWLVQEDGTTGVAARVLPDDPRISIGMGRPLGQAVARTYALARATGELVKVLDSDDVLAPGALDREIAVFAADPSVGWTTCRVLDLLPDGSTVGFPGDPHPGRLNRGSVADYWRSHSFRASVHPATLCIRRELVVALGGWMALPAGEDTGLMLALDAISPGYFIPEPGLFYRKWPGQVTADASHTEPVEWAARNRVIDERARVLAGLFSRGWPDATDTTA
jgi:glycosyltransferase involved in cell wall biosynthesis